MSAAKNRLPRARIEQLNRAKIRRAAPAGSGAAPPLPALALRSLGLGFILFQYRLAARDLADTPAFTAVLLAGLIVPLVLAYPGGARRKRFKPPAAALVLLLLPWMIRSLFVLARVAVPLDALTAAALDSLILNTDRNYFAALPPYYWAAGTTFLAARSRAFFRADCVISQWALLGLFCAVRPAEMEAYRRPVVMLGLFAALLFIHLLALLWSLPPETAARGREKIAAAAAAVCIVFLGGILLIRPSHEQALGQGKGLLQPTLLSFDFSPLLRLESEIRVNEDLILIVRKPRDDAHIFLRRFILSGYTPKQGFFRSLERDEAAHPRRLPGGRTLLDLPAPRKYQETLQEYFLVNFDASAFIGMHQPAEIIPYAQWDASSFSSAYMVKSHTSEALPLELFAALPEQGTGPDGGYSPADLGLSAEDHAHYTEYGGDERIASLAREMTLGLASYWELVQAVYEGLRYGEYRYSLRPGIAPDGDQLAHFLFQSKKGYCSYYAFAMTLLLRSLGIPARAAAGFFVDTSQNTFDYYPVRADMAHAWVEVYYPQYGWIEYDPTTEQLAEREDPGFSSGISPELFERLMREILNNPYRQGRDAGAAGSAGPSFTSLGRYVQRFMRRGWPLLAGLFLALTLYPRFGLYLGARLTRDARKKTRRLWAHAQRRLWFIGCARDKQAGAGEWARSLDGRRHLNAYALYQAAAEAQYAPAYGDEGFRRCLQQYRLFSSQYGKRAPRLRRLLANLCPLLTALLPKRRGCFPPLLALGFFWALGVQTVQGQAGAASGQVPPGMEAGAEADTLFNAAAAAKEAEYWERAIELYALGERRHPQDDRFPWALGSLYYSRGLYGLAWDAYQKVEQLLPDDPEVLYRLSRTAGYLNRDALSAHYLERLLRIEPDNREAAGSLAWMYYKLHRLREGEALLRAAVSRLGPDPEFSMTLGTIYSDLFQYDEAKTWYLDAITRGEALGAQEFTAVAHYNLSILESRFYHYAEAFDRTGASLAVKNRASGRLARGELFLRRLDISRALGELYAAYEIDGSPLSKINLAQAYQTAGRLEEAKRYAEDCLRAGDLSWMINYGIDPDRHKRDIHEILLKTYRGLAMAEGAKLYPSWGEQLLSFFRRWGYYYMYRSHEILYKKYSLLAGHAYGRRAWEEGGLDAQLQYYHAFDSYPRRALGYLQKARDFEVPLIPESETFYAAAAGKLLRDKDLLGELITRFDPLWERDMIAEIYTEICRSGKASTGEKQEAAERLYALNPGALRQRGIRLPAALVLELDPAWSRRTAAVLRGTLKKTGVDAATGARRFRLSITLREGGARCELYDGGRGSALFQETIPLGSLSRRDISGFAQTLGELLFIAGRE
ncbi:MAG: tetratricopeptide repeat protein [Treponema sp.]|jgi:transglutaminase-like putative cysteine protease/Tfp pilus assembly protein PilF|nr:tetratricopeptide repeat protein [Treponema sp.]